MPHIPLVTVALLASVGAIVWGAETFAEHLTDASARLGVSTFALALPAGRLPRPAAVPLLAAYSAFLILVLAGWAADGWRGWEGSSRPRREGCWQHPHLSGRKAFCDNCAHHGRCGVRGRAAMERDGQTTTTQTPLVEQLSPVGLWTRQLDIQPTDRLRETIAELEELGWRSLWTWEVFGREALTSAGLLLCASRQLVIGTGIANIWARDPVAMAATQRTLTEAYPVALCSASGSATPPSWMPASPV